MAPVAPTVVHQRLGPLAILPRFRVGQRRPIGCGRFPRRARVPRRDPAVEVRRLVRPVRPGRELVDRRRVDGVLALLRALDVSILAAPFAEEVACRPLPVGAAPAAAFCDQCGSASVAGFRAPDPAAVAALPESAVGLAGSRLRAPRLRAPWRLVAEDGVRNEALGESAAPLGDEKLKVHVVLRSGDAEVRRSPDGGGRAQAGHLAPARSERQRRTPGLTGRARPPPWARPNGRAGDAVGNGAGGTESLNAVPSRRIMPLEKERP